MSRTDKRSGRASYLYKPDKRYVHDKYQNLLKACFGANWQDEIAPYVMVLSFLEIDDDSKNTDLKYDLLKLISKHAQERAMLTDGDSLISMGNIINTCFERDYADSEAVEIIMSYISLRMPKGARPIFSPKSNLTRRVNQCLKQMCSFLLDCSGSKKKNASVRHRPSGKELARFIDEERRRQGFPTSGKTHDAIRERALRLGLKLKGKRKEGVVTHT